MNEFCDIVYTYNQNQQICFQIESIREEDSFGSNKKQQTNKTLTKRKLKSGGGKKKYHWTLGEQRKYINFLIKNRDLFDMSLNEKKSQCIHRMMSRYIQSRDSTQCRSHHQKMMIKYGSIARIIEKENENKELNKRQCVDENNLNYITLKKQKEEQLKPKQQATLVPYQDYVPLNRLNQLKSLEELIREKTHENVFLSETSFLDLIDLW